MALSFANALARGGVSPAEALAIFDTLEPIDDLAFMLGAWRGTGFPSGHRLDGLLELCRWRGKRFDSPEHVHPLVFSALGGGAVCVDPRWPGAALRWALRLPVPRSPVLGRLFQLGLPLIRTRHSAARLRMMLYRGRYSATMIYDTLPILDIFRRVDERTVLGAMDFKGMAQPLFFVLQREPAASA